MSNENTDERRRKVIGILFVIAVAAMAVAFVPTSVMAATFTMDDSTVTTENGKVNSVTADVSGEITWDGAETDPGSTDIEFQVKNPDGSWTTIDSETTTLTGLYGSHSYSFTGADVLSSDWSKNDFAASGAGNDGATTETDVEFRLKVTTTGDLNGDGSPNEFTASDTSTIIVNNEPNNNNAGGNGNTNANGPQGSP